MCSDGDLRVFLKQFLQKFRILKEDTFSSFQISHFPKFCFYWPIFLFTSSSLAFFIAKTMSLKIRAQGSSITDDNYGSADHHAQAHSKTQYVTWAIAAVQPIFVWILTYSFTWFKRYSSSNFNKQTNWRKPNNKHAIGMIYDKLKKLVQNLYKNPEY